MSPGRPALGPEGLADGSRPSRRVLNVGCGPHKSVDLEPIFPAAEWLEVRLDVDPGVAPDIVASMTDMAVVPDGSMDAVWSSHTLEHLYAHDVQTALREYLRVLRPGGVAAVIVPDLQMVARRVADDILDEPVYMSVAGPILPMDMIFGYQPALAAGKLFMAHKTGFTLKSLGRAFTGVGFEPVLIARDAERYELRVIAYRPPAPPDAGSAGRAPGLSRRQGRLRTLSRDTACDLSDRAAPSDRGLSSVFSNCGVGEA